MLVDTDVLIWYLRGNTKAANTLERIDDIAISAVTYIELVQGMRNKNELRQLRVLVNEWGLEIIPITEQISNRAIFYIEEHFLSHSLRLGDALIASTAVSLGLQLLSGNAKHFKIIHDLSLKNFKP